MNASRFFIRLRSIPRQSFRILLNGVRGNSRNVHLIHSLVMVCSGSVGFMLAKASWDVRQLGMEITLSAAESSQEEKILELDTEIQGLLEMLLKVPGGDPAVFKDLLGHLDTMLADPLAKSCLNYSRALFLLADGHTVLAGMFKDVSYHRRAQQLYSSVMQFFFGSPRTDDEIDTLSPQIHHALLTLMTTPENDALVFSQFQPFVDSLLQYKNANDTLLGCSILVLSVAVLAEAEDEAGHISDAVRRYIRASPSFKGRWEELADAEFDYISLSPEQRVAILSLLRGQKSSKTSPIVQWVSDHKGLAVALGVAGLGVAACGLWALTRGGNSDSSL